MFTRDIAFVVNDLSSGFDAFGSLSLDAFLVMRV